MKFYLKFSYPKFHREFHMKFVMKYYNIELMISYEILCDIYEMSYEISPDDEFIGIFLKKFHTEWPLENPYEWAFSPIVHCAYVYDRLFEGYQYKFSFS